MKNKVGSLYQSQGPSDLQDHWIRRLVALIVDSIIVGACTLVIEGYVFNPFSFPLFVGLYGLWYFTLLETFYGSTFGKRIMNLKTTKLDGKKPPFDLAFIRNVSKIYWILVLIDTLIGLAASGDPHQKVTDRITGTTVVSTGGSPLVYAHSHLRRATKFCFYYGQRLSGNAKYYLLKSYSHVSKLIQEGGRKTRILRRT